MVAGQMGDIEGEKVSLTLEELAAVHEKKTGALIEFLILGRISQSNRRSHWFTDTVCASLWLGFSNS